MSPAPLKNSKTAFYLLPIVLFFFLVCPDLVQLSMYNDGLWYAIISNNLANGEGSFWYPKLTDTIFPTFHEHPPLVFGIQSLFFSLLGGSVFTEHFYAFFIFLLNALLIVAIWRKTLQKQPAIRQWWFLPLCLWMLNEVTYLFFPGNILEPTLSLFTLLSILTLLHATEEKIALKNYGIIALAGILVFCATLSKGFVGLFPLAFFGLHWLVFRKVSFSQMMVRSLVLLATLLLCYSITLSYAPAFDSLQKYINRQVLASVTSARTEYHYRENRLYIIGRLFSVLLPALTITFLISMAYAKKIKGHLSAYSTKLAIFFLLIGFSASIPLAISPKQSFYYLLPAIPYFALGLGLFVSPFVDHWFRNWLNTPRRITRFNAVAMLLLLVSISSSVKSFGTITGRDRDVLHDVLALGQKIPAGATVASDGDTYTAYLIGYLYRFHRINVDTNSYHHRYFLTTRPDSVQSARPTLRRIPLETRKYTLFQHDENQPFR